jgi:D-sedoheptulose 7-phosphate isomerase
MTETLTATDVRTAFARRDILTAGLDTTAPELARACHAMAGRFARGGRLLAFGEGLAATDAAHVVVEFAHPVIVGKRALPALRLADPAWLPVFAEPDDIALGFAPAGGDRRMADALATAVARGLLTVALVGADGGVVGAVSGLDHVLAVPSDDARVVREAHVTTYHVLWELVHVFLEAGVA